MPIIPISCPYCLASAQANSDDFSFKCSSCDKTVNTKDAIVNNYLRLFTDKETSAIASICNSANTRSTGSGYSSTDSVNSPSDFVIRGGVLEGYKGAGVNVVIPGNVVEINANAFTRLCIRSVKIPGSVTKIKEYAFSNCGYLTSVDIAYGVKVIGDSAFRNCSALTSVNIPNSVTEIGSAAFWGCTSLIYYTGPDKFFDKDTGLSDTPVGKKTREMNQKAGHEKYEALRIERLNEGLCPYCGRKLVGMFSTKCPEHGKIK